MGHVSKRNVLEFEADRAQRLALLKSKIDEYTDKKNPFDFDELLRALAWSEANFKSENVATVDDEFSDPLLIVEELVKQAHAEPETLLAAVLYPSVRPVSGRGLDHDRLKEIEKLFGYPVRRLVKRTLRFRSINLVLLKNKDDKYLPGYLSLMRLMFLWAARDPRAILNGGIENLIKLKREDKNPGTYKPDALKKLITDANEVYAPLTYIANYGGLRDEFMDYAYKLTDPSGYQDTKRFIASSVSKADAETIKDKIATQIELKFGWQRGVHFDIDFRPKSAASARAKATRKNQEVSSLGDLWAARIVLKMPAIEWPEETNVETLDTKDRELALADFGKKDMDVYGILSKTFGRYNKKTVKIKDPATNKIVKYSFIQRRFAQLAINESREEDRTRGNDPVMLARLAWEKIRYPHILDALFDDYINRPKENDYSAVQDKLCIPISDEEYFPLFYDVKSFIAGAYSTISTSRKTKTELWLSKSSSRMNQKYLQLSLSEKRKILNRIAARDPDFEEFLAKIPMADNAHALLETDKLLQALHALGAIDNNGIPLPDKTKPVEIECQVVDVIRHNVNTYGPRASHISFKTQLTNHSTSLSNWWKAWKIEATGRHYRGRKHVYVSGEGQTAYDLTRRPTVEGFLAATNENCALVKIVDPYCPGPEGKTYDPTTPVPNGCQIIPVKLVT